MTSSKEYTTNFVLSKDGTKIGYRQLGTGSRLILVHGGMMASQNFMTLAKLLANEFMVYIPDRRGRGLSYSQNNNYSLLTDSEDLQALIHKTNAQNIFGLSSGAIVVLQTAITGPALEKVALYEPPIPVNGTKPGGWADDYELAMSESNLGKAMIRIIKGTGDRSLLSILPGFITIPFMNFAIKADAKELKGADELPLKALIPTMRYDIKTVLESEGIIDKCNKITAEVLLLGGQKSQRYLKITLDALSAILPQAKRIEFSGVGHLAADNSGKPETVANELRRFFNASKT